MSSVKLAGALPKGTANGLEAVVLPLVQHPDRFQVVLAIIDCKTITTDADTGEVVPTARIRRIEVVLPGDRRVARGLMERALEERTGRTALPLDLEDELRAAFEDFIDKGSTEAAD